jgi:hypothetical protein
VVPYSWQRAGPITLASDNGGIGEDFDNVSSSFDFFVQPLQGVGGPDLFPVGDGEGSEGEQFGLGVAQHGLDLAELAAEHAGDHV